MLQTSVPTPVTQLAPSVPSGTMTLPPGGAVDDVTVLRDPFQGFPSNPTPSVAGGEVVDPPPTSSATSLPEVTSVQTTYGQPLQTYNSFGNLFPARFFPSTADMPPSMLVHSLVQIVVWTTTVLRGMLRGSPLPSNLVPMDEGGRLALMPTPFWPGGGHSMTSPLEELLGDMLPTYMELLNHGPYTY